VSILDESLCMQYKYYVYRLLLFYLCVHLFFYCVLVITSMDSVIVHCRNEFQQPPNGLLIPPSGYHCLLSAKFYDPSRLATEKQPLRQLKCLRWSMLTDKGLMKIIRWTKPFIQTIKAPTLQ